MRLEKQGWKQITKSLIESNPISVGYMKNKIKLVVVGVYSFRNNKISFILS